MLECLFLLLVNRLEIRLKDGLHGGYPFDMGLDIIFILII